MGSRSKFGCWILILTLARCLTASAESAEEKALTTLWAQHQKDPAQHQAVADACAQFEKSFPQSPMVAVARGLGAWHLLKMRNTVAATSILNSLLSASAEPFPKAGNAIALRWLTRLDRERVKLALQSLYKKRIEYPGSLDALAALPATERPPATDRFGKPWVYNLEKLKYIAGATAQSYTLQSSALGPTSDLAAVLKIPYADAIKLRPTRVMSAGGGGQTAIVEFQSTGPAAEKAVLSEGTGVGAITFVHAGEKILILADGDYWLIVPRPGA